MKQKTLFFATIASIATVGFAIEPIPQETDAPLPTEFVQWQESPKSRAGSELSGLIPSPVNNTDFLLANPVKKKSRAVLPIQFDLRKSGYVTTVKAQGQTGNCWAFTTIAALEGSALREGFGAFDLSEKNLRNCTRFDRDLSNALLNDGGNSDKSLAYLTRWDGPVLETEDPYDSKISTSSHFAPAFHLGKSRVFTGSSAMKQALTEGGPLYTSMCSADDYYNYGTATTFYLPGKYQTNHAITLVGWNDTLTVPSAPKKGAWLCKNSWGDFWGDTGYFWLAYADSSAVTEGISFEQLSLPKSGESLYYYDTLGHTGTTGYGIDSAFGAISVTIRGDETVTGIGTWFMANNSRAEISVFKNRTSASAEYLFSNPVSSLKTSVAEAGYYTVALPTKVEAKAGEQIHVVIKYVTPKYTYPIPLESPISGYSMAAKANPLETFISYDGAYFTDMGTKATPKSVAIKVFTSKTAGTDISDTPTIQSKGCKFSGTTLTLSGNSLVEYSISNIRGQTIVQQSVQLEPGIHSLQMPTVPGIYVVRLSIDGTVQTYLHTIQ